MTPDIDLAGKSIKDEELERQQIRELKFFLLAVVSFIGGFMFPLLIALTGVLNWMSI